MDMPKDRLRILVIDDNPADAGLLRRLLGKNGEFAVDFVHRLNEADGKEALSSKDFDCLFLDYQLGETSGLDVLDSIRALGYDLAVIVLTGAGDESVAVEAMKRGAQDYLVKDIMVRNVLTPKGIHHAITNAIEKVSLERRLRESQRELREFTSVVAHDLKTPLCGVKNNVELVRDLYRHALDDKAVEFLEKALRTLDRQFGMIEGLLEYSRIGRSAKELKPVDLRAVAESVIGNLDSLVQQSQGRVIVGDMPVVQGDSVALSQLLQNLTANAFKFRGEQAPVVRLEAVPEQDGWRISVRDNGIGIDPQHHKDIFIPLRRLHSRNQYEGLGIGLATCKRIVEQHDGRIWVTSERGNGTSFHFTLRRAAADSSAGAEAPSALQADRRIPVPVA